MTSAAPHPLAAAATAALRLAALAPPSFKSSLFERVCAKAVRTCRLPQTTFVTSNLGVAPGLKCRVPVTKFNYAFGRPANALPERATLALCKILAEDSSAFVDVGANAGIFTFAIHHARPGLPLHWFEPDQDLYQRLANNLADSGVAAIGNEAAVSEDDGTAQFLKNLSDDLSGSLSTHFAPTHDTRVETVRTIALGRYLRQKELDDILLKIDVEGAGVAVWAGLAPAVDRTRYIVMEMLQPEMEVKLPLQIIERSGYFAYYIRDFELVASKLGEFDYLSPFWNWLFCGLGPEALARRLRGTPFRVIHADPAGDGDGST